MKLPHRRKFLHLAAGAAALAMSGIPTQAQVARLEVHALPSMTLSDKQILLGAKDGTPVTLAGDFDMCRVENSEGKGVALSVEATLTFGFFDSAGDVFIADSPV